MVGWSPHSHTSSRQLGGLPGQATLIGLALVSRRARTFTGILDSPPPKEPSSRRSTTVSKSFPGSNCFPWSSTWPLNAGEPGQKKFAGMGLGAKSTLVAFPGPVAVWKTSTPWVMGGTIFRLHPEHPDRDATRARMNKTLQTPPFLRMAISSLFVPPAKPLRRAVADT